MIFQNCSCVISPPKRFLQKHRTPQIHHPLLSIPICFFSLTSCSRHLLLVHNVYSFFPWTKRLFMSYFMSYKTLLGGEQAWTPIFILTDFLSCRSESTKIWTNFCWIVLSIGHNWFQLGWIGLMRFHLVSIGANRVEVDWIRLIWLELV